MTQPDQTRTCSNCQCEYPLSRQSCPSCGLPADEGPSDFRKNFSKYFIVLVIICALAIVIAPR
ncbi:hypothetical protein [Motiliproteus coralliicola]|uniref:hypothetical protein n=1 Tax=Motiliproteus coralliicola TaxID=2283196 RepID=UPI000E0989E6|nr:hypothetical protein [Motiliproteus coralliicola]